MIDQTYEESAMTGACVQRINFGGDGTIETNWQLKAESSATPGKTDATPAGSGMRISEISDASGTGNYIYEFVEIHFHSATFSAPWQFFNKKPAFFSAESDTVKTGLFLSPSSFSTHFFPWNLQKYCKNLTIFFFFLSCVVS